MTHINQKKNHYKALAFTALLCTASDSLASNALGGLEDGGEYFIKAKNQKAFLVVLDEERKGCKLVAGEPNKDQREIGEEGIFILDLTSDGNCYIRNKKYGEYLFSSKYDLIGENRYIKSLPYASNKCKFRMEPLNDSNQGHRIHNIKYNQWIYLAKEKKIASFKIAFSDDQPEEEAIFEFIRYQNNTTPTNVVPAPKPKPGFFDKWRKGK